MTPTEKMIEAAAESLRTNCIGEIIWDACDIKEYWRDIAKHALAAALAVAENGWQPIETAPKDGTDILICRVGETEIEITQWCSYKNSHFVELSNGDFRKVNDEPTEFWNGNGHRATHWHPLPSPPEET